MNQIMESDENDETVGSHAHKRVPGPVAERRNSGLFDPNTASLPSNPHTSLPEITRQILLDTSDSESERTTVSNSEDGNDCEHSSISKKPKISSREPESSQSPIRSSSESFESRSNSVCGSSSSMVPEPACNLRFVPSPHPDMIQCVSSGSGSSKSEFATEPFSCWKNAVRSSFPEPRRFDSTRTVAVASVAESTVASVAEGTGASVAEAVDSSGNFVAASLPKSRFTFKTSSSLSSNTKKRLPRGSADVSSNVERNSGYSKQWITAPSGPVTVDHVISGRFEDGTGGPRHSSSNSCNESVRTATLNVRGISSSQNLISQQGFQGRVGVPSEPTSKSGSAGVAFSDFTNVPSSSHIFVQPIKVSNLNYADVSHRAAYTKSEPAEFDPRSVENCLERSPTTLSPSHMPESGQAPNLAFIDVASVGSLPPSTCQPEVLHQTSNLRPERVGFDCLGRGRSESGTTNPRNIPSESPTLATCRPSVSSVGIGHSNHSYLECNVVDSGNEGSSGSGCNLPSIQSCNNNNPADSDSSNQEHRFSSEPSGSGVVIMSLVHKKNKIAGSSYNSFTGQVHLLESFTENSEFCTTVLALRNVSPSIVVLPSCGAARFVKELKTRIEGDHTLKDCQFQCLSPRYFAYGFARRTVLESSLWEGCLTFRSEDAKNNAIVSNINLNDERLVCAFGGLLHHLSTGCPQLGAGISPLPITSVHHLKLSHKLWLDTQSFKNLQIFDPAEHPSSFKWSSTNKDDGKSIFGLFERFCSSVGMTKLKSFLANPVNCRRILEKRHEVINFYLNHSNFSVVEALRGFASQMSSSSVIVSYLSSPTLRGGHWKHIYRHIYYTVSYAEVCRNHGDQSELFRELGSTVVDAVYSMAHNLERVVDLVNMENNETFVIKYGFHPPLDAAKEKFSRLKLAMDKVTPYEFDSVPSFITRIQMMYIPEMKFLLSIPYWSPELSKEELNLPNLEYKFTASRTAFYKSRRCHELDELLGDAQTDIINEESMIIQSLRNYLKNLMHHIVGMAQKIAEIECVFALAKVAREERYTKPEIVNSSVIDIRGGWHPLLGVPSNEVIANDMVSSNEANLVKLIYGPNASGKSIYLKQVGLIMYLVHVGSYVPAVSARVGLFGRILARTTMEESVISMSSTMLSELKKLQDAVMGCAKDTLVILDEVGKGSTEVNSIAILTSAMNYFLSQGSDCPHVLISTHLSGLSDFVMSPPHSDQGRNLFELLVMDHTITEGEIVFLYKVRQGSPDGSFVFEVLENSEFAAPIVKTARTVLDALRTGENFLPYCETRIQRSHKYLNFIRKFVNIDMSKPGYLEKLQNKIQRYYEKPSY